MLSTNSAQTYQHKQIKNENKELSRTPKRLNKKLVGNKTHMFQFNVSIQCFNSSLNELRSISTIKTLQGFSRSKLLTLN